MTGLLIIRTDNSEKVERVREFLSKERINYEIFYDQEDKLLQEYREAWQDPQRLAEAKQWEQASMNDWAERTRK